MVDTNCVKSVLNASDRTLIDEEYLEDVYDEAIRLKNLHKIDGDKTMSDVMKEWVAKRKVDAEKRRLLRQRNEAFNTVAQAAAISDIQKTFGTGIEAADGIIALYDGDGFYSFVGKVGSCQKTNYTQGSKNIKYFVVWFVESNVPQICIVK